MFRAGQSAHLKALSPIKNFLTISDKLGLQPNLEAYDPRTVLELPSLVLGPDLSHRAAGLAHEFTSGRRS